MQNNLKLRVYIASPYSNDWMPNAVRRQLEAHKILMSNGFVPFAPLISHFLEIYSKSASERQWLDWDLEWLEVCHILIRIKAFDSEYNEIVSPGADEEVSKANKLGIPVFVFDSIEELEKWATSVDKNYIREVIQK